MNSSANMPSNPFHEVYVTETVSEEVFVQLFSSVLIEEATDLHPLFLQGNVVLSGTQGCGKSMLLALFKPEIRLAYGQMKVDFPVPESFGPFIGAGINLARSGMIEFGQRDFPGQETAPEMRTLYFMDFLHYWIVRDLFDSIETLTKEDSPVVNELGLRRGTSTLDELAKGLAQKDCWVGYLDGIDSYEALRDKVNGRIRDYRDYLRFNIDELPETIRRTKTSAGEPISQTAQQLRANGNVSPNTHFFIRIDQLEQLWRMDRYFRGSDGGSRPYAAFTAAVSQLLTSREPNVSYRIGTRKYGIAALEDVPENGSDPLEQLRNCRVIDIDEVFRRGENTGNKLFRNLAEDVFRRRLECQDYPIAERKDLIGEVFGPALKPGDKAKMFVPPMASFSLNLPKECPPWFSTRLEAMLKEDPLSAKLGEAWVRQQMAAKKAIEEWADGESPPWKKRTWWKKERRHQALLQLAAARGQRMVWARREDILGLSGSSILAFLSICQQIWEAWLRSLSPQQRKAQEGSLPKIDDPYVQNEGIDVASQKWHAKITEEPDGDTRQRFTDEVGLFLRNQLRKDGNMSYPGANGFSLRVGELQDNQDLLRRLQDAARFGVLVDILHASKNTGEGKRRKWYPSPILCPYYQLPYQHTKEPLYVNAQTVRKWLDNSGYALTSGPLHYDPRQDADLDQMDLFQDTNGEGIS